MAKGQSNTMDEIESVRHEYENFAGSCLNKPRSVLSMILKFETLLRKSEYRGAYGLWG